MRPEAQRRALACIISKRPANYVERRGSSDELPDYRQFDSGYVDDVVEADDANVPQDAGILRSRDRRPLDVV
jgi:hypothetical protein